MRWGSSPLARGLPKHPRRDRAQPRIIPARAGFTGAGCEVQAVQGDHPRSRGVYNWDVPPAACWAGSSPLARGLPIPRLGHTAGPGIIPARAGFTSFYWPGYDQRPDHPRSRGVYADDAGGDTVAVGSSPLARGLPLHWDHCCRRAGIIPARAGFTHPRTWKCQASTDHPRSRGVYPRRTTAAAGHSGSSPLARGLPRATFSMTRIARIIPARAGFTEPLVDSDPARLGSSPLARGLLSGGCSHAGCVGIIPARAGFTARRWR